MKTASLQEIKRDLLHRSESELMELCLKLARFKKENKELLTYLLFESENEELYRMGIKTYIDGEFESINKKNFYFVKKSARKILKEVKKYIRYSKNKETEVELLLYYCQKLQAFKPSTKRNKMLVNLFQRQVAMLEKKILLLHEDLQYDYTLELEKITID